MAGNEDMRQDYKALREFGVPKDRAMDQAFSNSTYADFLKQWDSGPHFDDQAAQLAAVHTRLDVALLCHLAGQQHKTQRSMLRWLRICAALLVLAILYLADRY